MRKTEVLGISVSDFTIRESMRMVDSFFKDGKVSTIAVITMKGLLVAQEDEAIKEWMSNIDLAVPSDVEILRAGNIAFHSRIKDVENDVFVTEFLKKIIRQKKTVYLLSDNETNLQRLREELLSYEGNLTIIGSFCMDSTEYGGDYIANEINMAFADVLISNLESPGRESFFAENHMKLNVAIWMMVRADANLYGKEKGFFLKVHDWVVKQLFSIRLNKYQVEKSENNAEEKSVVESEENHKAESE